MPLVTICGHLGRQYSLNRLQQEGYDITPVQTRALACLSCAQKEVSQRDLERELRLRPSTVNGIVSRLEEKGYISRRTSPSDARCRLVSLTDTGRQQVEAFESIVDGVGQRYTEWLSDEENQTLLNLLARIIENLENEVNSI